MLMGRRLKTHLDLMRPDVSARVRARQESQKTHHDRHTRERLLKWVTQCSSATLLVARSG